MKLNLRDQQGLGNIMHKIGNGFKRIFDRLDKNIVLFILYLYAFYHFIC